MLYVCGSCGQEHDAFGDGDIDVCPQCQMTLDQALAEYTRALHQPAQQAAVNALGGMHLFAGYGLAPLQQQPLAWVLERTIS